MIQLEIFLFIVFLTITRIRLFLEVPMQRNPKPCVESFLVKGKRYSFNILFLCLLRFILFIFFVNYVFVTPHWKGKVFKRTSPFKPLMPHTKP